MFGVNDVYKELTYDGDKMKQMQRCLAICNTLNEDRKEGQLCDATIVVEGKEFTAHKSVLGAFNSYFSALFEGPFCEKNEQRIEILGVSKEVFETVLDFMYGAQIELTLETVKDIYMAGDMLCLYDLIEECQSYIKENWKASDDFQAIYEIASHFEMNQVCSDIIGHARQYFSAGMTYALKFREVSHSFLLTILEGRDILLHLQDETSVLRHVILWAFQKPEERIPDLVLQVLATVRFEFIVQDDFVKILDFNWMEKTSVSTDVLSGLKESLEKMYSTSNQYILDFGVKRLLAHCKTGIFEFTFETAKWKRLSCDVTENLCYCVLNENDFYVFTSSGGSKVDLKINLETVLPDFPEKRVGSTFSVVDKTVYVMGGRGERTFEFFEKILSWKPFEKHWNTGITLGEPISHFRAITYEQNIYLVGKKINPKWSERHFSQNPIECFVYNTLERHLEKVCTLSGSHGQDPFLAIHEDVLYILLRYSDTPRVQAIDLRKQEVLGTYIRDLELHYPIVSVCSVNSGILVAYSIDSKICLSLYRQEEGAGNSP